MRLSIQLYRATLPLVFILSPYFLTPALSLAKTPIPDAARPGYQAISATNLEALLKFIAADELEGRNTGDRGLNIAAKFLQSQYTIAGLTPVPGHDSMLQTFEVMETKTLATSYLSVIVGDKNNTFKIYNDFYLLSRHRENTSGKYQAIFAGFGIKDEKEIYDDYKDLELTGKIVLVLDSSPEMEKIKKPPKNYRRKLHALRRSKAKWAEEAGALAIIHINTKLQANSFSYMKRRLTRPGQILATATESIRQLVVNKNIAEILFPAEITLENLKNQLRENPQNPGLKLPEIEIVLYLETEVVAKSTQNVVAYLEGSDPVLKTEVVAFGAHYDHIGINSNGEIYNGADDDGSGTVGILEIARAFVQNHQRPKRSLLFVSHAGEEKGLLGSRYYTDHPLVHLKNTVAQLNIDMIGRNDPNSVYIIGSNYLSKELHRINEAANAEVGLNLDYSYNDRNDPSRFYYRSDHYNYAKHGIPIIFYFSGTHEDYHKPTDTIEKIDFHKIQRITRLAYLTGWKVANLEHNLSVDGILLDK